MRSLLRAALAPLIGLLLAAAPAAADPSAPDPSPPDPSAASRIVSVDGAVTEIVYALGQGGRVVATDTTSSWPAEVASLPKVGYKRSLTPEGLLSLRPDLILASSTAGPAQVLDAVRAAGVPVVTVPDAHSTEGVLAKVRAVAVALGLPAQGEALAGRIAADLETQAARLATVRERPRVLFVMDTGQGGLMAAGRDTAADAAIALAGGINAFAGVTGLKPLTPEAAVLAAPQVIVVTHQAADRQGGLASIAAHPALALTPAVRDGRLVSLDALLVLGFGPRIGEAVRVMVAAFHPELPAQAAEVPR
ncbi:heme/hemin ABC transporter substrate-binding protein [Rhodospirillum centenum]|uniref:Hemin-binding periplasmic protein HmuT, putative n=1 Tax=Rhodospirillum centenum (strain ATCC 51521 / SW) TaxID=414684 RepID=B6IY28_RHOCS|nr:ABC transporter substrate-binding protein [Rhodospirillum centenum]ACJ01202.1 hemin-binding periplasmic protein HmuT precursor, putative [Rhodospirillum centenum SW]